jgi:hypothetical protein
MKGGNLDNNERLDSWKEIASYINRRIRTCIRWEKELGLPVYRIDEKSIRSRVFAYKKEIDQWFKDKSHSRNKKKNTPSKKHSAS